MSTDHWNDLKAAGHVPPPSPEVLAHARTRLSPRRRTMRRLVPVVSLGAAAAVVAGVLFLGPGAQLAGPKYLEDASASCAFTYSPEQLKQRDFAFDGTVVAIEKPSAAYGRHVQLSNLVVTFTVNEWFKPGGGGQTKVLLPANPGHRGDYAYGFPYEVGSRLLITGAVNPDMASALVNQLAWACHFSRFYDKGSAREWRETLGK
jgi:hypothetical protein